MSKYLSVIAIVVALVSVAFSLNKNTNVEGVRYAGVTNLDSLTLSEALVVGTTATLGTTATIGGQTTLDGGTLQSSTNSTSTTATSQTLASADIKNYDTILMTPNTGALTLTFPASSTLSTFLPAAGDMQTTCFINSTSTAAATITFAASTGIDLETASSTRTDLTLLAGNTACFRFIRQKATASAFNITAAMTEYMDAD